MAALVGRDTELGIVTTAVDRIADGGTWLNVIGAPGIGKTALLVRTGDDAVSRGLIRARATCAESEMHLGYAALYQLLVPFLGGLDQLPEAHAAALRTAFGLGSGPSSADPFHVALAALELLADAAAQTPLLAVVDDLHWCDRPSLDAIEFVGRRIAEEPVVLLTSTRPSSIGSPDDATTIELGPLDLDAASELLRVHSPALSAQVTARTLRLAAGNPLALRELPRALVGNIAAGRQDEDERTLTTRLERAFGDRVAQLRPHAQLVLLVAALQDGDSLADTDRAARLLVSDPLTHLDEAVASRVISLTRQTLRFEHPLTRSAVVQRSSPLQRARVHAALAETLAQSSPERATWHRSAAHSGPDDALATELEANAEAVGAAGRAAAAIPWLIRAAELTTTESERGRRLVRAGEMSYEIGDHLTVAALASQARALALRPSEQARLVGLESAFDDGVPGDAASVDRLTSEARSARGKQQDEVAAALLMIATRSQYWRGAPAEASEPVRVELAALGMDIGDPRKLCGVALLDPFQQGEVIVDQLTRWSSAGPVDPALATLLALSAFVAGDFDHALTFARAATIGLRQDGRITFLAQALVLETFSSLYLGHWDVAFTASHEALRFAQETKQPMWAASAMLGIGNVAALKGDHATATALADQIEDIGYVSSNAALINGVQLLRGFTAMGQGDAQAAFDQLRRMFDRADPAYHSPQCVWALDYFAEAARGCRNLDAGREVLESVERLAAGTPAPGIRRAIALARAWLADDDEAEAIFAAADHLSAVSPPWYRARLALSRGMWLRRRLRPVAARDPLRVARTGFASLGASAWSARAARELAAAGAGSSADGGPAWAQLSAQELQIAQLAASGLSNREIGARLYLSHRTVGSHLYRLFPSWTSRREVNSIAFSPSGPIPIRIE